MNKYEADRITRSLLREYGLVGWTVRFSHAVHTAGMCDYTRQQIVLSAKLMTVRSHAETLNTIRHEVAHALCGAGSGHGPLWVGMHKRMGGDGKRCFALDNETRMVLANYAAHCGEGCVATRQRRPKHADGWKCRKHGLSLTFAPVNG